MINNNAKSVVKQVLASGDTVGLLPAVDVSGTTRYVADFTAYPSSVSSTFTLSDSSAGISVGSGSTSPTDSDYQLENTILSGLSGSVTIDNDVDQSGNTSIRLTLTVTNTSSSNITISEIGYKQEISAADTAGGTVATDRVFLLDRSVFSAIVLEPSGQAIIDYTLKAVLTNGGGAVGTKTITQNGTYNAISDNLDGYSSVIVNVSGGGGNSIPFITNDNYMFEVTDDRDADTLYANTGKYYIVVALVSNSGGGGNPTLDAVTNGTFSSIGTIVGDGASSKSCVFRVYLVEKTDVTLDSVLSYSGIDVISWIPLRGNPTIGTFTKNDDVTTGQFSFTASFNTPTILLITGHRLGNDIIMNGNTVRMCSSNKKYYMCGMAKYDRYIFTQLTCIENDGNNQATIQLYDNDIERAVYCYFPISFS